MLHHLPQSFAQGRLRVVDERIRDGAVDFKLQVRAPFRVGASVWRAVLAKRPTIAEHACSAEGRDEPADMTIPHLVEHVAIDLLVERRDALRPALSPVSGPASRPALRPSSQEAQAAADAIAGYTVWLDHRRGLARVTLASSNAAATECALLDACGLVAVSLDF